MASLSDLLTAAKNIAAAINSWSSAMQDIAGVTTTANITTTTLVRSGQGRLCMVSIVVGGSASGLIYDSASVSTLTKPIWTIVNTPGLVFVNLPVTNGIVVVPGTSQNVTVSWS